LGVFTHVELGKTDGAPTVLYVSGGRPGDCLSISGPAGGYHEGVCVCRFGISLLLRHFASVVAAVSIAGESFFSTDERQPAAFSEDGGGDHRKCSNRLVTSLLILSVVTGSVLVQLGAMATKRKLCGEMRWGL